jgi:pectate lyase
MIESFRIGINFSGFSPIPPEPEIPLTAFGWGGLYNSGAGITGAGDIEASVFSDFQAMWDDIAATSKSTPKKYLYTGPDVTYSIGAEKEFGGITAERSHENKTIIGMGQRITGAQISFRGWKNCIWENFDHYTSHNDLISINNSSEGIWVKFCTFDGQYLLGDSQIVDGCIDITNGSDYILVSHCAFTRARRGHLIGGNDDTTSDAGKLRVTCAYNHYFDMVERIPFVRYGKVHMLNNLFDNTDLYTSNVMKTFNVAIEGQIYTQRNVLKKGRRVFDDNSSDGSGGIVSDNNWINTANYDSAHITPYRPENVTWNPNTLEGYEFNLLMTESEVETYVLANAGVKVIT